jgi:hypothetical protein
MRIALALAIASAATPGLSETAHTSLQVGATVVESAEAVLTTSAAGKAQLSMRSPAAATISADAGVEIRGTSGSWTASAASHSGKPRYVTVTYF